MPMILREVKGERQKVIGEACAHPIEKFGCISSDDPDLVDIYVI